MDYLGLLQDTNYNLASSRIKGVSKPGERFDPYPDVSSEKIRARSNRRERRRFFPLFLFLAALMLVATSTASAQGANTPPAALPDMYATDVDTPVTLLPDPLVNDSDADGDPFTLVSFDQPANGSVSESAGVLTYTPDTGFVGLDTFTYTITDGTDNSLGSVFIEVGSPSIDLFVIQYGDTISDGVPGAGAGNIEVGGAQDVYTFQGMAGQEAIFDRLTGSNSVIRWRLQAPDGTVHFDVLSLDRRISLPQTGTYMLTVYGTTPTTTTSYSFRLLLVPAPEGFAIGIGDTVSDGVPAAGAGNVEMPGAADIYTFDGMMGQGVVFDWLTGSNGLLGWQ